MESRKYIEKLQKKYWRVGWAQERRTRITLDSMSTAIPLLLTTCRIFWIAMLLTALGIFIFYLSDRLIEYFKYKRTISVEERYVSQMEFPVITLCNQNIFRSVHLSEVVSIFHSLFQHRNLPICVSDSTTRVTKPDDEQFVIFFCLSALDLRVNCTFRGQTHFSKQIKSCSSTSWCTCIKNLMSVHSRM